MASVKVMLLSWKKLNNGENPIALRIIKDRKRKLISIGHSCSEELWDDNNKDNKVKKEHPNSKRINLLIRSKINDAERLILQYEEEKRDYTLEEIARILTNRKTTITVLKFHDELIERFNKTNKLGNARVYNDSKRSLKKFNNDKDFYFSDITYSFLKRYERYFREHEAKETAISYYMRTLRAVYNTALKEGYCKKENYPFIEYKISDLNTKTAKRALSKDIIQKIAALKLTEEKYIHARNYFLFSYYNMGLNFTDLARLKWSNIVDGRLQYQRAKTAKIYGIKILEPALKVLDYYKEKYYQGNNGYIFPILSEDHKTETSIRNRIHKIIGQVNKNLKELPGLNEPNLNLTTYVARHSWATIMKKSGVSTSIISADLGHDSERTTQVYLDSFENEVLDEANKNIL
ncbi:MAG: site-specific integrase [Bacteroidota bacterium]|nr:MAG: site-specific integrase [Bacteroidota bacterium]